MDNKEQQRMDWFKIHHNGWLEGTLRSNLDIDGDKLAGYRGVFTDLCALISRSRLRDGTLRRQVGQPMERQWIANVLNISLNLLSEVIEFGKKDLNPNTNSPMVKEWKDGTIELTGWSKYQVYKKTAKQLAREAAIAKAKQTNKAKEDGVIAMTRAINEHTKATRTLTNKVRYIPTKGNKVVDTLTGEVKNDHD